VPLDREQQLMLGGRQAGGLCLLVAPPDEATQARAQFEEVLEIGLLKRHIARRYRNVSGAWDSATSGQACDLLRIASTCSSLSMIVTNAPQQSQKMRIRFIAMRSGNSCDST
jgi:hypothetical protein